MENPITILYDDDYQLSYDDHHYYLMIISHHYIPSLYPIIISHHYIPSLYPIIVSHHYSMTKDDDSMVKKSSWFQPCFSSTQTSEKEAPRLTPPLTDDRRGAAMLRTVSFINWYISSFSVSSRGLIWARFFVDFSSIFRGFIWHVLTLLGQKNRQNAWKKKDVEVKTDEYYEDYGKHMQHGTPWGYHGLYI